jgi:hypothetical protein
MWMNLWDIVPSAVTAVNQVHKDMILCICGTLKFGLMEIEDRMADPRGWRRESGCRETDQRIQSFSLIEKVLERSYAA